jgi:hypothetical protein
VSTSHPKDLVSSILLVATPGKEGPPRAARTVRRSCAPWLRERTPPRRRARRGARAGSSQESEGRPIRSLRTWPAATAMIDDTMRCRGWPLTRGSSRLVEEVREPGRIRLAGCVDSAPRGLLDEVWLAEGDLDEADLPTEPASAREESRFSPPDVHSGRARDPKVQAG